MPSNNDVIERMAGPSSILAAATAMLRPVRSSGAATVEFVAVPSRTVNLPFRRYAAWLAGSAFARTRLPDKSQSMMIAARA